MLAERELIIGLPVHNDKECLSAMVKSLFASTKCKFTLVIVESGSTDGSAEICDQLILSGAKVIHTPKEGPLKAYNRIFQIAKERNADLLLTQTDVIFPKLYNRDWLNEMRLLAQNEGIGAVVPWNGGRNSGPDYVPGFYWLGGWCTYFSNKAIEKVGGYDETFPNGFGVDIDHTYRLVNAGFKIAMIDYWVDHHMQNSREHDRNPDTEKMKADSAAYFRRKHGL